MKAKAITPIEALNEIATAIRMGEDLEGVTNKTLYYRGFDMLIHGEIKPDQYQDINGWLDFLYRNDIADGKPL